MHVWYDSMNDVMVIHKCEKTIRRDSSLGQATEPDVSVGDVIESDSAEVFVSI